MLRVGLTGGLASGKSTIARFFTALGAHVLMADLIAHDLMAPGQPVYHAVIEHFGRDILTKEGVIDRSKLAKLAFGDGRIEELNKLVHPTVIAMQEAWMAEIAQREKHGIAIVEAALIFEAGASTRFQKIVVVSATPEQKLARFAARLLPRGTPEQILEAHEEAKRRIATQVPDSTKAASADFVIDNSGTLQSAEEQTKKVFAELQKLSKL